MLDGNARSRTCPGIEPEVSEIVFNVAVASVPQFRSGVIQFGDARCIVAANVVNVGRMPTLLTKRIVAALPDCVAVKMT